MWQQTTWSRGVHKRVCQGRMLPQTLQDDVSCHRSGGQREVPPTEAGGKERSPPIPIQSKERGCRCRIFGDEEGYEGGGGAYLDYDDTTTSLFSGDSSTHGRVRVFVPMMVPFCISLRHYLYLGLIHPPLPCLPDYPPYPRQSRSIGWWSIRQISPPPS